ncbi:SDR family NAD(P)-dependent oxidoreductase [Nocardioides caeni]|uniref:SDR family oxidoreductase n=1 Tax=Nocardioides caeni TaxID=574700 RepID=A0A4V4HKK7_9ACTN|nr:SDR family oxidoreductase [Nocardioides caeni]THV14786.1 SDR family oxidoreductase [Nocardioides caeni]
MTTDLLAGRRILVTGGSRGLGLAMARAAGEAGAELVLAARSRTQLDVAVTGLAADGIAARAVATDLSDAAQVADLVASVSEGGLHGVIHAAGIQHREAAADFTDDDLRRVLDVNLESPFRLTRELVRHDACDTLRSVVLVGSLGSSIAIPRAVAYAASKAGLLGLARTLAAEWAPRGIRVNVLSPGYFHTELTADLLDDPVQHARVVGRIPMGRLGQPAELGGGAVFLLSDWASYVTGQQLIVDGGWLGA